MHYEGLILAALSATCSPLPAEVAKRSSGVVERDGRFHVDDTSFAHQATYTFENGLPDGLAVSNESGPPGVAFVSGNARVADGYLELLMQAGRPQSHTMVARFTLGSVELSMLASEQPRFLVSLRVFVMVSMFVSKAMFSVTASDLTSYRHVLLRD